MIEKAKRTYATEIEGKTAVVLVGDQGAEIGFPAVRLSAVFENAKRLATAAPDFLVLPKTETAGHL
jgi:hypothetical protein